MSADLILKKLKTANTQFKKRFSGEPLTRQPVHTVYGGAQLFKSDTTRKIGELAVKHFNEYAKDASTLGKALGLDNTSQALITKVWQRVREKLEREAVEDFRIDFEDGYGTRPDKEEDACAEFAAGEMAKGWREKTLSPFIGIRIKCLSEECKVRSFRTVQIFIETWVKATKKKELPENFVVTLPKVTIPEQITALVSMCEYLEKKLKLHKNALRMEFMVEAPQAILNAKGESAMPAFLDACKGRCVAAHFGTYDFTASNNITAAYQQMDHPACDFAREMMKLSLTDTGIWLSDGATNVMPVGPHKNPQSVSEREENAEVVHRAWRLSFSHIWHSLKLGFYQGWDLHPGQLPIRYATCYLFFLQGLESASQRLKNFMDKAAQATLVGDVFDDAATGQGLLNYFLRAYNCGAIKEDEILAAGLTLKEVQGRSFAKILEQRRKLR